MQLYISDNNKNFIFKKIIIILITNKEIDQTYNSNYNYEPEKQLQIKNKIC